MFDISSPSIWQALFVIIILVVISPLLKLLYNISPFHPLSSYPGSLTWRATRLSWIIALQRGNIHNDIKHLHDIHGPIVRIAPNELSYIDARAWKDIYGGTGTKAAGVFERNSTWFKPLRKGDPSSIMGADEAKHAKMRRALMPAFTEKATGDMMEEVVQGEVEGWVGRLREMAEGKDGVVDIVEWFNWVLFDISGLLTFGESFGSVRSGKAHPWVAISSKFGKGVALRAGLNFLGRFGAGLSAMMGMFLPKEVAKKVRYHMQLSREMVQKKLHGVNKESRAVFLDAVVKHNETGKGEMIEEIEIDVNASILIFAGAETTATALSGMVWHLVREENRAVLKTLQDEIRARFKEEEDIKASALSDMKYLDAVIKEGIRLSPPSAIGVPRVVPKGGAVVAGRFVPEGTFVAVNQIAMFRAQSNFKDPEKFKPERFLEETDAGPEIFQPFGLGRHQCLGMRLAWAEMRLILTRFIYAFDIEVASTNSMGSWAEQKTFIFWEKEPLMIKLRLNQVH